MAVGKTNVVANTWLTSCRNADEELADEALADEAPTEEAPVPLALEVGVGCWEALALGKTIVTNVGLVLGPLGVNENEIDTSEGEVVVVVGVDVAAGVA